MFEYQNTQVHYEYLNSNFKNTLVYLHGWGQNISMMEPIATPFKNVANILLLDLPGFGKSLTPDTVWSLYDYAAMLNALIKHLKIKNPIIIGHSFGGKIGIIYASSHETQKLILIASPYKVSRKKVSLKVKLLKKLAKIPFLTGWAEQAKLKMGSTDYRNATPQLRNILVSHVNTDVSVEATKIKCPTIIIWGSKDTTIGVENAYELEKLIPDSAVILYPECTHYCYLEELNKTIRIINSFIS